MHHFLIAGTPNTDVQITILDPDSEKKHIYIVTLPSEGKCNFSLDLDGYKPGVYDVEITDYNDDATTVFTVGMQSSVEESIVKEKKIPSPLKQFKSGITIEEIQCKESLTLVKKYDGTPACVKEQTIPKLIERGWTSEGSVCLGGPGTKFDENCVRIKN